jgi:hypothetical protein
MTVVAAPSKDSNSLLIGVIRDIVSLSIVSNSGHYSISGKKTDGRTVSWAGTSRVNALLQLDKFETRLA